MMTLGRGLQIVLAARPEGKAKLSDFRKEEFTLLAPGHGELLIQVNYLSLDPYMRGRMNDKKSYAEPQKIGQVMPGESAGTVIVSNHPYYQKGDLVLAQTGWRTHAISQGESVRKIDPGPIPVTAWLGVLGMPGFTAYVGLKVIGKPKPGETVVVAAATGPVGSLVGQLAKIADARAVGIAGGSAKCTYATRELGFDAAADHRSADFREELKTACPNGIDVYFENVGGMVWQAVLPLLNRFARVPVSELIAQYDSLANTEGTDHLPATMRQILSQRLLVQGLINYDFTDELYADFQREVSKGISEGRIKYREDIVDDLENAPEAFMGMLAGKNFGKLLVRVAKTSG
jgi:NADPH-dependent curcumin reductase